MKDFRTWSRDPRTVALCLMSILVSAVCIVQSNRADYFDRLAKARHVACSDLKGLGVSNVDMSNINAYGIHDPHGWDKNGNGTGCEE